MARGFAPKIYASPHDSYMIVTDKVPGGIIQFNGGKYVANTPELVAFLDELVAIGSPIEAVNAIVHTEGGV